MDAAAHLVLTIASLMLAALAAAAAGARVGAPLLLVFLGVGMLAGPEGPGGIVIADVEAAYAGASAALAVILLDGGARTKPQSLRLGLAPGVVLATGGVLVTALLAAAATAVAFGAGWRESVLMGAIVSSTDAAAVFALLGARGDPVKPRLSATLETESGFNDPFAVFLTVMLATSLIGEASGPLAWLGGLIWQIVGGAAIGAGGAFALRWARPRARLTGGLRPLLTVAAGLFAFGFAQTVGASGFLAVYLFGLALANSDEGVGEAEASALDGFAWLAQLALFLMLGLLATPSHLTTVAAPALAVALALMLFARPAAVFLCLHGFEFSRRERAFAAWVGLRGATPIFLGLVPIALGVPNANLYFSVAVVVVVVSLIAQGWTTPAAARLLGVYESAQGQRFAIGRARLAAIAVGAAAFTVSAALVARETQPTPVSQIVQVEPWSPSSVEEFVQRFGEPGYTPPERLPADWSSIEDPALRQRLFIEIVAPMVRASNVEALEDRAKIEGFGRAEAAGRRLSLAEQAQRDRLARKYDADYEDLDGLLRRADAVPVSLAVAHAAVMTGWGSSGPALDSNALFGQRPRDRRSGYDTLAESTDDFFQTLNTKRALSAFREERARLRADGPIVGAALAGSLSPFAQDGAAFAEEVRRVIETAGLAELDQPVSPDPETASGPRIRPPDPAPPSEGP